MIASVRVRQLVAFLSGFLLFLAINRIILHTHSSASQARFDQITPKLSESVSFLPLMHDEESGHHGGDAVVAEETRKKIRLFAFILTNSTNAAKKAPYIKSTWTHRVERFLFLSNEDNSSLPAIKTVVEDKKETHFQKVITGLLFVYRQNIAYFDYYIKAEDDTYVVPENLRFLLRAFDPDDLIMMGHVFQPNYTQTDKSDRAAYVLSRGALLAVAAGASKNLSDCRGSTLPEHVAMAKCAESVGVRLVQSVDPHGKECFHPLSPYNIAVKLASRNLTAAVNPTEPDWISDHSALFDQVPEDEMYVLEYLIYHLYTYGVFRDPEMYSRALRLLPVALPKMSR